MKLETFRKWKKRLICLCFGIAVGAAISCAEDKKYNAAVAWLVASMYGASWLWEAYMADSERKNAEMWKKLAFKGTNDEEDIERID